MQFFNELGAVVEKQWSEQNYDDRVFPGLAAQALAESDAGRGSPWEIVRWLNSTSHIPAQQDLDGVFGDPPITLFNGPRFHIDIYFWLDGTTAIHHHSFCGAFQVLLGSSIHSGCLN